MLHLLLILALTAADAAPAGGAAPATTPPAPESHDPAPPGAEAPKKVRRRSVTALRQACYGGKGEVLMEGVRRQFESQADVAMLRRETAIAIHWFRRVLAGGGETPGTLRRLGIALLTTGKPEDSEAANACADLLDRLWPPTAAPAPVKAR